MRYIITGGHKLTGTVRVSGNKNSIFPCFAAALLTEEEVTLENISDLKDTQVLIEILKKLGVKVTKKNSVVKITAYDIKKYSLPQDLMVKLRGSICLIGALLARVGKVNFYHPGGDVIGRRSIQTHLEGLKALGAKLTKNEPRFSLFFEQGSSLQDCEVFLQEASVTATENLILASVLGKRITYLRNCAKEPHVVDLCKMLTYMGAKIEGIGKETLRVCGVDKLRGVKFRIGADFVELGTYIVAGAITGGEIKIKGVNELFLDPILKPLKNFGIKITGQGNEITVYPSKLHAAAKLVTNIWPGFPTDLMSVAIVLATQADGVTLCHDWMYEGRMFFTDKLISMGAKITLCDPHRVLVSGPSRLRGHILETPDIRAGMALVMAALAAKGKSIINQAELIERGYEDVVGKLKSLGAEIERIDPD